tara:strand:- start:1329 stop:1577 length:249 start_codon:yes stop_codon:yes gene_type:complete
MSNKKNSSTPKQTLLEELVQLRDYCAFIAKERWRESQRMAMVYFRDPSNEGAKVLAIEHGTAAETHATIGDTLEELQSKNRP